MMIYTQKHYSRKYNFIRKIKERIEIKKRFTEEQIVRILGEEAEGKNDTCREYGIALATYYVWKKKYANMSVSEVMELKQLRDEVSRLKILVADLSLDNKVQKHIIKKYCSSNQG